MFFLVCHAKVYPPISDEELAKAANMIEPTERNETVWDNSLDHDPHHDDEAELYSHLSYRIPSDFKFGRWPNGVLPYIITDNFTSDERSNIARVSTTGQDLIKINSLNST